MARITLGKRTRSSTEFATSTRLTGETTTCIVDPEVQLPAKRVKRQTRSCPIPDENADREVLTVTEEDREEAIASEITEESLSSFPQDRGVFTFRSGKTRRTETTPIDGNCNPITPSTLRFRDALALTPVTPRHRVMSVGKVSKRLTPQTPLTPSSVQTVYHHARQLFSRNAGPSQLIGRDAERIQLRGFLQRCSKSNPSGCLYVSGPPGTGKSAMVNELTQEVAEASNVKKACINCMSIKSSKDLYATLLDLVCDETEIDEVDAASTLQKLFMPRKKSSDVYLVVLDEIDHILTLDLESLYRLFEWSLQKTARLVLVGIANALDLTDRFLPRLKSRNLKPNLLPFLPYSAIQIKTIITTRLRSLVSEGSQLPFIHPAAIELCARKVASQTGDLRKAFEICRRAIDLVEMETKQKHEWEIKEKILLATPSRKVLGENNNLSSSSKRTPEKSLSASLIASLKNLTIETAPRVTIAHLNKVTAAAFSNGTNQRLKTLNLQQKAALCSLVALEKRNRAHKASVFSTPSKAYVSAPSIKILYETYCRLCTSDSVLHPLSSSEFREVVGSLETLSLVSAVDGKTGSFTMSQTPSKGRKKSVFGSGVGVADEKRVASCVGEKEMEQAVEGLGAGILQSILSGEALD
ncbi:P-loop containing nucleoside triphosphate hydrolase protein [Pseudomassariella vexata]|uniref:Cell division control protein n=1 Tax=Pseudomassariella vexata TaxID=1141098 RepID=A0A1Y2DS95_9PEZI|nr:P-loop containing nucleoside triphosphate hydrolase protein [Pseudomassariella vexata]ORY62137.1 P-loop containing nucleoside triphosphate hydrolase protein [Pseudomassariella vexata]